MDSRTHRGQGIPLKGNYSLWLGQKAKRLEQEAKGHSKRRKILERELEWVRLPPKARHAKSKARLNAYDWFLDRVTTYILAFEGDSNVYFFEGSFSEYEENLKNEWEETRQNALNIIS